MSNRSIRTLLLMVNKNASLILGRPWPSIVSGFLFCAWPPLDHSPAVFRLTVLLGAWQHTRAKSISIGGNLSLSFRRSKPAMKMNRRGSLPAILSLRSRKSLLPARHVSLTALVLLLALPLIPAAQAQSRRIELNDYSKSSRLLIRRFLLMEDPLSLRFLAP